jgi:formylglycine-generating enzyme required for sulfatase activity
MVVSTERNAAAELQRRPCQWALFDFAGNAVEWVEDCWNDSYIAGRLRLADRLVPAPRAVRWFIRKRGERGALCGWLSMR